MTLRRDDGHQALRTVAMRMPAGLLARIADVDLCAEAQAVAGACRARTRIGSVTVGAGAGPEPFHLPGRVHMAGPYKGAPFSLVIVVPAIAGPFDLGTVVVRAAVHIDRRDTSLTVVADPMPTILEGVRLNLRTLNVTIDRERFMVNPTTCAPMEVDGTVGSVAGAIARVASRFQLGGCGALPFRPRLTIKAGRRGRIRGGSTTPLEVTLRMTPGQANNRSVQVTLPRNMNSRMSVINDACTLEQFRGGADACKQVGSAVAITPLLRHPLVGRAYFVRNPARRIPDLMVALRGQGRAAAVAVDLTGKVTIPSSLALRTRFDTIPDVPITRFTLRLVAGRRGPVGFVRHACSRAARKQRAAVVFRAASGAVVRARQRVRVPTCARAAKKRARTGAIRR